MTANVDAAVRNGSFEFQPGDAALYIHWPFCESKCPYCDFNSHVVERIDEREWRNALVAELDHVAALAAPARTRTVFLGGGTPSLMSPSTVAALLDAAARSLALSADAEITLEANPSSVEAEGFRGYRDAGVNRISIGVQSLDDSTLGFLGRRHSSSDARRAVAEAHRNFQRVSLDLIYAVPGQGPASWRRELREALTMTGDHMSLYQLTIEKGTAFHSAHRRGMFKLPDDELALSLYEVTQEETARTGHRAYEVSNHARPGGQCRHNLLCWQGGDYIGVGPGAHGRIHMNGQRHATERISGPAAWLCAVGRQGHGTRRCVRIERREQIEELLITGLRLANGLDRALFRRIVGSDIEDCFDSDRLAVLEGEGLISIDGHGLRATGRGLHCLNSLIAELAVAFVER